MGTDHRCVACIYRIPRIEMRRGAEKREAAGRVCERLPEGFSWSENT